MVASANSHPNRDSYGSQSQNLPEFQGMHAVFKPIHLATFVIYVSENRGLVKVNMF